MFCFDVKDGDVIVNANNSSKPSMSQEPHPGHFGHELYFNFSETETNNLSDSTNSVRRTFMANSSAPDVNV